MKLWSQLADTKAVKISQIEQRLLHGTEGTTARRVLNRKTESCSRNLNFETVVVLSVTMMKENFI